MRRTAVSPQAVMRPPNALPRDNAVSLPRSSSQQPEKSADLIVNLRRMADDQGGGHGPHHDPTDGSAGGLPSIGAALTTKFDRPA